jgi:soluble lytic murein transglycosylase-like protein
LRRVCFSFWSQAGLLVLALFGAILPISGSDAAPVTSVVRADSHSGKLVRVVAGAQSARAHAAVSSAVERIAAQQALPPELIRSVIKAESNYDPFAISPKGALGIMQLIPETARRFGVSNAFNAEENIQGGAKYLKYLLDLYHGDYPLALAAYNAGEGAVAKHGGVPPYPETRNYINKVLTRNAAAESGEDAGQVSDLPANGLPAGRGPAPPGAPEYNHIEQIVEPDGSVRYVSR